MNKTPQRPRRMMLSNEAIKQNALKSLNTAAAQRKPLINVYAYLDMLFLKDNDILEVAYNFLKNNPEYMLMKITDGKSSNNNSRRSFYFWLKNIKLESYEVIKDDEGNIVSSEIKKS